MSETNSDTKDLILEILRQKGIDEAVTEVKVTTPDLKGEHMLSIIETVEVIFSEAVPKYFFVKNRLRFPNKPDVDANMKRIMKAEGQFLKSTVADMKTLCEDHGAARLMEELLPEVYYFDVDRIVMEDLSKQGYGMLSKTERQDFNQASLILQALARFHAVSHIFLEKNGGLEKFLQKHPEYEPNLPKPEGRVMLKNVFEPIYEKTLLMLKMSTLPGSQAAYRILERFSGKLGDTLGEVVQSETIFPVICHGDLWTNNIMFHHSEKKVVFVDFQRVQPGSPNLDIGCYIFTSVQREARLRWRELLQVYLRSFGKALEALGRDFTCSLEDFAQDYSRKSKLGFFFGVLSAIVFEAIEGDDVTNRDDEAFSELLTKWVKEYPKKAEEMCQFLIDVVQEYSQIGDLNLPENA